jgi:hypothetical protein
MRKFFYQPLSLHGVAMRKIKIVQAEFEDWLKSKPILYASTSVQHRSLNKSLRFYAYIDGRYKVTFGNEILYEGKGFKTASNAFNNLSS